MKFQLQSLYVDGRSFVANVFLVQHYVLLIQKEDVSLTKGKLATKLEDIIQHGNRAEVQCGLTGWQKLFQDA